MREDDEEKKLAIKNEYLLTNALYHPNLPHAYELYENELTGEIQIVLDRIPGDTLEHKFEL